MLAYTTKTAEGRMGIPEMVNAYLPRFTNPQMCRQ